MLRLVLEFAPVVALWGFLWFYSNAMNTAEREAFWAMIGLQ